VGRCFSGQRRNRPGRLGNSPTEAVNELVDATELMRTLRPASGSPAFTELKEVPS